MRSKFYILCFNVGCHTDATNTVHLATVVKGIYDHHVPEETAFQLVQKILYQAVKNKLKGFSLSIVNISSIVTDNALETIDKGAGL